MYDQFANKNIEISSTTENIWLLFKSLLIHLSNVFLGQT